MGEYRRGIPVLRALAERSVRLGRLARASGALTTVSRFLVALGDFAEGREARIEAAGLAERLIEPSYASSQLVAAEDEVRLAVDEGWGAPMENVGPGMGHGEFPEWSRAANSAAIARIHAHLGRVEPALRRLASVLPAIDGAPAWAGH